MDDLAAPFYTRIGEGTNGGAQNRGGQSLCEKGKWDIIRMKRDLANSSTYRHDEDVYDDTSSFE
jgi:hypothetical protein